jgi:hypothetical protein
MEKKTKRWLQTAESTAGKKNEKETQERKQKPKPTFVTRVVLSTNFPLPFSRSWWKKKNILPQSHGWCQHWPGITFSIGVLRVRKNPHAKRLRKLLEDEKSYGPQQLFITLGLFPPFPPPPSSSLTLPSVKRGKEKEKKKGGKKKEESSHNWCWLALTRKNEPAIIQKFSFLQRNWMECIFGKKKEKNELNFLEPGPIPPSPRGGLLFAKKTPPRRRGHSWF